MIPVGCQSAVKTAHVTHRATRKGLKGLAPEDGLEPPARWLTATFVHRLALSHPVSHEFGEYQGRDLGVSRVFAPSCSYRLSIGCQNRPPRGAP